MSETATKPSPSETSHALSSAEAGFGSQLSRGLEMASQQGFDLQTAIRAEYSEATLSEEAVQKRAEDVLLLSAQMAEDMRLKPEFFDRPANTVLLTAIAESWLSNEDRTAEPDVDKHAIAKERETLVDIASMLAGSASAEVVTTAQFDPRSHDRYIKAEEEENRLELESFYESLIDQELSDAVTSVLSEVGSGSFLARQREALGLTKETESNFVVKVLKIADDQDFYISHIEQEPVFPGWDSMVGMSKAEKDEIEKRSNEASALFMSNQAARKPFYDALDEYNARFSEFFGELPHAFIERDDEGRNDLYIRTPHALALIKHFSMGELTEDSKGKSDFDKVFSVIRHEYAHTQKPMTIGSYDQLGIIVEERKAEHLSDDNLGYEDIKYLLVDLSQATSTEIVSEILDEALKENDPASAFVAKASQRIGLRNTLLLMALKPLAYDKNPTHSKTFADLAVSKKNSDESTLDIPVRETLERMGEEKLRGALSGWANRVEQSTGLTDYHEHDYPEKRKRFGFGISARIIGEEVAKIRAKRKNVSSSR